MSQQSSELAERLFKLSSSGTGATLTDDDRKMLVFASTLLDRQGQVIDELLKSVDSHRNRELALNELASLATERLRGSNNLLIRLSDRHQTFDVFDVNRSDAGKYAEGNAGLVASLEKLVQK